MNSKENENKKIGRKECNEITTGGKVPFVWDTVPLEYKDIVAKHVSAKGRHTNSRRQDKENVQQPLMEKRKKRFNIRNVQKGCNGMTMCEKM